MASIAQRVDSEQFGGPSLDGHQPNESSTSTPARPTSTSSLSTSTASPSHAAPSQSQPTTSQPGPVPASALTGPPTTPPPTRPSFTQMLLHPFASVSSARMRTDRASVSLPFTGSGAGASSSSSSGAGARESSSSTAASTSGAATGPGAGTSKTPPGDERESSMNVRMLDASASGAGAGTKKKGTSGEGSADGPRDKTHTFSDAVMLTITYEVKASDRLGSIAAQFDTTPSVICRLNKLPIGATVFPGQKLKIPDSEAIAARLIAEGSHVHPPDPSLRTHTPSANGASSTAHAHAASKPKPGHRHLHGTHSLKPSLPSKERLAMAGAPTPTDSAKRSKADVSSADPEAIEEMLRLERIRTERFVKSDVKHITDTHGTISGTLIVTPNVLMFDPSASEPAVRELGLEPLGLTVPLLDVERVKVYNSDAALRLRFPGSSPPPQQPSQTPQLQPQHPQRTDAAETSTSEKKAAETGAASGAGEQPASGTQKLPSATAAPPPATGAGAPASSEQSVPTETKLQLASGAASEAKTDASLSPPAVVVTEQPQSAVSVSVSVSADAAQPAAAAPVPVRAPVVSLVVSAPDAGAEVKAELADTAVEAIKAEPELSAAASKTDAKHVLALALAQALTTEPSSVQPARPRTPQPIQVQLVNAVSMKERADLFQPIEMLVQRRPSSFRPGEPLFYLRVVCINTASASGGGSGSANGGAFVPTGAGAASSPSSFAGTMSVSPHKPRAGASPSPSPRASAAAIALPAHVEYWFAVPQRGIDELYAFFLAWVPDERQVSDSSAQSVTPEPLLNAPNLHPNLNSDSELHSTEGTADAVGSGSVARGSGESPTSAAKRFGFVEVFSRAPHRWNRRVSQDAPATDQQSKSSTPQNKQSNKQSNPSAAAFNPSAASSSNAGTGNKQRYASAQPSSTAAASTAADAAAFFDESYENLSFEVTPDEDPNERLLKEWELIQVPPPAPKSQKKPEPDLHREESISVVVPELRAPSSVFTDEMVLEVARALPLRLQGFAWQLVYSNDQHGFSLATLYRRLLTNEVHDRPLILAICDMEDHVFGAILSNGLHVEERYYGTGECSVFSFVNVPKSRRSRTPSSTSSQSSVASTQHPAHPVVVHQHQHPHQHPAQTHGELRTSDLKTEIFDSRSSDSSKSDEMPPPAPPTKNWTEFRLYRWSGENNFFTRCTISNISIGAGHGQCGLWLDENLYHGRTQYCDTFYNEVLTGPETSGDFVIKRIECWSFDEA